MVTSCPNIRKLRLSEFGLLDDSWLPIIAQLTKLTHLDLARPGKGSFTDDAVIELLKKVGHGLRHLDLSRHVELADPVLLEGVAEYCPNLTTLRMEDVSGNPDLNRPESIGLTDDGVARFFDRWKRNGSTGCAELDFHGCHSLQDAALRALVGHSHGTLEKLNISGWKEVSAEALRELGDKCKRLTELDVGWCRSLTDFGLKDILDGCPNIKLVKVWGACAGVGGGVD